MLHFIRHTSVAVERGLCYGQMEVPLSDSFEEEALSVRIELEKRLGGRIPDLVLTSPLSRCTLLASACGYPNAQHEARLLERNFGSWEGKRYDDISDPQLQAWYEDWIHVAPTNGESFAMLRERVMDLLSELRPHREVILFTHAGVLSAVASLLGEQGDWSPHYGEILSLETW